MTDSFNYSLVKTDQGTYSVRSTVTSFNLDHVTDKDIVSFYSHFSSYASFDTGLLPLNGTGVLAIRSAGYHTQIVTQHQPGLYYVNWGAYEGDRGATAYHVAQPYRIVIGDFEKGNLLGARMFYSPYPITHPNQQLYHVNLPNINCKGYRGNGVGWICLYHKDDWSALPFNEKVSRFIERCSGVETYNDANMSETDGPRFYQANNKPDYLYDPNLWQKKSANDGFHWTLDEHLWIPVLVQDIDHQDKHYNNGQPLTISMAMLGNYQAYYTDTNIPKMYNVVSRQDYNISNDQIASLVKSSFAAAPVVYTHTKKDNPYSFTVEQREKNGSATLDPNALNLFNNDQDEESEIICNDCDEPFDQEEAILTPYGYVVCSSCINENYTFLEHLDTWYSVNDNNIVWSETDCCYYHEEYDNFFCCENCGDFVGSFSKSMQSKKTLDNKTYLTMAGSCVCVSCFQDMVQEGDIENNEPLSTTNCFVCSKLVVNSVGWSHVYPSFKAMLPDLDNNKMVPTFVTLCNFCAPNHHQCPCGLLKNSSDPLTPCTPTVIDNSTYNVEFTVSSCCQSCISNATEENGFIVMKYNPFNSEIANEAHAVPLILHTASGVSNIVHKDYEF